ncbi:MAG TPA: hypothetical protein V6C81_02915 [Planktothrix sp.]|jgi:hypothetical protein
MWHLSAEGVHFWSNIATVAGLVATVVCLIATAIYVPTVRASRAAYRELLLSDSSTLDAKRTKYWALEKKQKRAALTAIACYGIGLFVVMPFGSAKNGYHLLAVAALTLLLWTVAGVATFMRSEFQIRMEVDDIKHQEELRKIRAQRTNNQK